MLNIIVGKRVTGSTVGRNCRQPIGAHNYIFRMEKIVVYWGHVQQVAIETLYGHIISVPVSGPQGRVAIILTMGIARI